MKKLSKKEATKVKGGRKKTEASKTREQAEQSG